MAAEKRVALAIGNATYAHASVLKTPSNDARLIATMFRTIGFTEVREQHDLDKAAFDGALDRFAAQARSADWALIYYAGHAVEIGGAFYLLPTDANVKGGTDLDKEGISLGRVLGPESRPHRLTNRGPRYRMQQLDQARRDTDSPSKWPQRERELLVVLATGPGRGLAASPGGNGAFASSLAHRIAMPGLDIQAIFDQVRQDVLQATNGRQVPGLMLLSKGTTSSSPCPDSPMSRIPIIQPYFLLLLYALLTIPGTHSAQAQMVCEPPHSQEGCSCVWDVLARAFPAEEHALLAEHMEVLAAGREGQQERLRAILPDESKMRAFIEKWIKTLFTAGKNKECSH